MNLKIVEMAVEALVWSMKEIVCFVKIGAAKKDCFLASNVEHLGICTFLDDLHQPKKANFMQNDDDWILPGWTSWTIFQRVAKIITSGKLTVSY